MSEQWLTLTEAAGHIRAKSTRPIRDAVKANDLPCYGYGREMRFKASDLDDWLEGHPWEPKQAS
jgi:excisionase family DNA binding protein